jgi:hypothetical protein
MNSGKWIQIKQTLKSRQTAIAMLFMVLGLNATIELFKHNASNSGSLDLASRYTERITLANDVVVQVQWDSVRANGKDVVRVTGIGLPTAESGKARPTVPDCGSACTELRRYIDQRVGFNTEIEISSSMSADRKHELITGAMNNQFGIGTQTSQTTSKGTLDAAKNNTFRANGEDYRIREYLPFSNGRLYARVTVEGSTCDYCGPIIPIPDSVRNNTTDLLNAAARAMEDFGQRDNRDRTDRDRARDPIADTERNRRTGEQMLENILRDCRREHGNNLTDRTSRASSRTRILRHSDDTDEYEIGTAAVDELGCRSDKLKDLLSASNNSCTSLEDRRDRTCADSPNYITAARASQFFARHIEPHMVRGIVNSTNQTERTAIFDMIQGLDEDIAPKYSSVLNRITTLSETAIRSSGNRVQDRMLQAQKLASVNPALAVSMQKLAQQEMMVLQDSAFRLMNTHSMGLYNSVQNGNLSQHRAMGLFADYTGKISPITQCSLYGGPQCAALGIGVNQNAQINMNTIPNRTLGANVIGGRTLGLRQESVRSGVNNATGFQPVLPGQLTSFRGLTN